MRNSRLTPDFILPDLALPCHVIQKKKKKSQVPYTLLWFANFIFGPLSFNFYHKWYLIWEKMKIIPPSIFSFKIDKNSRQHSALRDTIQNAHMATLFFFKKKLRLFFKKKN
jgi:hypothetical protein